MAQHLSRTVPGTRFQALAEMFDAENADRLLSCWDWSPVGTLSAGHSENRPAFVLDCIDNINTKAALISACVTRQIRCISAMGAGAKADPTRILIGTIGDATRKCLSGVAAITPLMR